MIVKFELARYSWKKPIVRREFVRETSHFYVEEVVDSGWFNKGKAERREAKREGAFFDTFDEAKLALIQRWEAAVVSAKRLVLNAERELEQARALQWEEGGEG